MAVEPALLQIAPTLLLSQQQFLSLIEGACSCCNCSRPAASACGRLGFRLEWASNWRQGDRREGIAASYGASASRRPRSVCRIASSAPMPRRRAVSMTERTVEQPMPHGGCQIYNNRRQLNHAHMAAGGWLLRRCRASDPLLQPLRRASSRRIPDFGQARGGRQSVELPA